MKIPKIKRPSEEILQKVHSLDDKKGMIAAIEPDSGEWFLGKDEIEAVNKGRKKYPAGIFYCVRIGYQAAHILKERVRINV